MQLDSPHQLAGPPRQLVGPVCHTNLWGLENGIAFSPIALQNMLYLHRSARKEFPFVLQTGRRRGNQANQRRRAGGRVQPETQSNFGRVRFHASLHSGDPEFVEVRPRGAATHSGLGTECCGWGGGAQSNFEKLICATPLSIAFDSIFSTGAPVN